MKEMNLKILRSKHKKVEGIVKQRKEELRERHKENSKKRHARISKSKKEYYKNYAWWGDFSGDLYYKNYTTSLSGLFGQYEIITNGKKNGN